MRSTIECKGLMPGLTTTRPSHLTFMSCWPAFEHCCGVVRKYDRKTVHIADLVIDTRSRRAWRSNRPIELTAKEYALLDYLSRHVDRVVGRAEIAEHVWDEAFDPFSNLIEVYIQRLRRKVDEGHSSKLLRTLRGEGYMLCSGESHDDV